jgi:hypothetical protein
MPRQVFRYRAIGSRRAPILTIGIKLNQEWLPVDVYVDSGAAYTLLHARIAEGVGRDGVFSRFDVCFHESNGIFSFET